MEQLEETMDLLREKQERQTKFSCIAQKAKENPEEEFTSLAHHLSFEYLLSSFSKLRKSAASGIDKVKVRDYEQSLSANLDTLHTKLRTKTYKAPDIRRVWIDKDNGKQRPLGISTTEDKIVQKSVTDLLNLIYEQDFYDFSYGFRPGHNAHQALTSLREQCMRRNIKWILDADIQGCFDHFDHSILRELLTQRVKDKSILRLINLWLKAGIIDGNSLHRNRQGTPQGNIISPLLSNVYLHYVLDQWLDKTVRPLLKGEMFIVRYADDFIIGFEYKEDAQRVNQTLPKRMQKYGLTIHPEKSQLIRFEGKKGEKTPTFDFLGFTHYWGISKRSNPVVKRRTSKKKLQKAIKNLSETCRQNKHMRLKDQCKLLSSKLRGMYQYYGIKSNFNALYHLYRTTYRAWFKWLNRRSQKKSYTWEGFKELMRIFVLPRPRIIHHNV